MTIMTARPEERTQIIYEDTQGTWHAVDAVPPSVYPLGIHFALEGLRWENGGSPVKLVAINTVQLGG